MFHFKHFSLYHEHSTLKIGTDSVLLAASIPLHHAKHILDIGCGCGIIAYCLAWRLSTFKSKQHFTGIDIDEASILEAQRNIEIFPNYPIQSFLFVKEKIQQWATTHNHAYDLIVTNPPYFGASLKPDCTKRLLSHHRDETLPFHELSDSICTLLSPDGKFFLILPPEEMDQFHREIDNKLYRHFILEVRSAPNKAVSRIIAGYCRQQVQTTTKSLTILDQTGQKSKEYELCTKDFYL